VTLLDPPLARVLPELVGQPIVIATHPRSGTHLMIDALRWRCGE
jgi:hypothetical protein